MKPIKETKEIILTVSLLILLSFNNTSNIPVIKDTSAQQRPAIYGDYIVWFEEQGREYEYRPDIFIFGPYIYVYDLSTREKFLIAEVAYSVKILIYGDIIVWDDSRNGPWNSDIYGYNLSTQEKFQITTDPEDQRSPAIYENTVVWSDERNGNSDIYGYNLSTREEFQITTDPKDQHSPAIYGDIVVWTDERKGWYETDIYGYNLSTQEEFQITTDSKKQEDPAIYGDIVVWQDFRNLNWDIYGFNLNTKEESQITADWSLQQDPAIFENIVIWVDCSHFSSMQQCFQFKKYAPINTKNTEEKEPSGFDTDSSNKAVNSIKGITLNMCIS